jgi:DNA-binding SARP family transcriptional activator
MLKVCVFGSLAIQRIVDGITDAVVLAGRPATMFAYLALARGQYFNRNDLMTALWVERADAATAGTFNTTLWRLRRALECAPFRSGELIASARNGPIGLHRTAAMQVDIEEFSQLIAPTLRKPLEQLDVTDVEGLRRGVMLYKADILLNLKDEWALREREKYRRVYLNALGRLVQVHALTGDYPAAIRYAQAILDCDALREDVHRELMRLLVRNGQRALALRQFELCRALLKRELAINPMRETVAVYQEIANGAVSSAARPEAETPRSVVLAPEIDAPPLAASELLEDARAHLAHADRDLRQTLELLDH